MLSSQSSILRVPYYGKADNENGTITQVFPSTSIAYKINFTTEFVGITPAYSMIINAVVGNSIPQEISALDIPVSKTAFLPAA